VCLLSQFEKWQQKNWKDYSFTKWNKDFGQRLVGKRAVVSGIIAILCLFIILIKKHQ
jgi:hypothetical protein